MRLLGSSGLCLIALVLGAACSPPAEIIRPDELRFDTQGATSVVVVYSRSGHTARAGRALAKHLGADYQRLTSRGTGHEGDSFFATPSADTLVPIEPEHLDLGRYRLVILGTPIWYWKPTALINSFIETADLRGKDVVLFYTNEGGISKQAVARWRERVEKRGGRVKAVLAIDRKALAPGEDEAQAIVKAWDSLTMQ